LSDLFKIDKSQIGDINFSLVPQAASTGLWDIMLPIKTKDDLYVLNPDFKAFAEYTKINKVGGVHAFTLDTEEGLAESRNFCPPPGSSALCESVATATKRLAGTEINHSFC